MREPVMRLYRTPAGTVLERDGAYTPLDASWDALIAHDDLHGYLASQDIAGDRGGNEPAGGEIWPDADMLEGVLAPIGAQEVWAAGVTYERSRSARVDESHAAGGSSFYDRVYDADRPELFFKTTAARVRGPDQAIRVRRDSGWSVPEPELAIVANARGGIVGYTIGNDVSARDIEGENPLYLPQAKIYDGACALGPALLVTPAPLPPDTPISLRIERGGAIAFEDVTPLARMRRTPADLVAWLFRELAFPHGVVLLTGTGIVPPDDFTLSSGDVVTIAIPPIGALRNRVE